MLLNIISKACLFNIVSFCCSTERYYLVEEKSYSEVIESKVEPKDPSVGQIVKVRKGGKVFFLGGLKQWESNVRLRNN